MKRLKIFFTLEAIGMGNKPEVLKKKKDSWCALNITILRPQWKCPNTKTCLVMTRMVINKNVKHNE